VEKPVSLFTRLLIVIVGFGLMTGFIYAMVSVEKRIAAQVELENLTTAKKKCQYPETDQGDRH
jgi:hypothetical protein